MLIPTPKNCDVSVKKAIQLLSTKLDYNAERTFGALTLSKTCNLAAGINVLRVTGLQTDNVAMTGTLRGAYIDVSNGALAATGTIRGMELKARTEAPGDIGNDVAVLEGLSISADSKGHSVTTMRAAEFILDGKTGGTITEAVGLRIANNLQANKATTSYGLQIYRDSFDYTADIQFSNLTELGNSTFKIDNGQRNIRLGTYAFTNIDEGRHNVGIGYHAGYNNDTEHLIPDALDGWANVYIGSRAGAGETLLTGTITATNGSAVLVGNGTSFNTEVVVGDIIRLAELIWAFEVTVVTDNTHLTIGQTFTGTTTSGIYPIIERGNNHGTESVAIGHLALLLNKAGEENTAVGDNALKMNTTGCGNVALGNDAMQGHSGTPITGSFNTAIGSDAIYVISSGSYNTSVGYQNLKALTTANYNVAIGYQSGFALTTGASNVFVGHQSGYKQTTSGGDVMIGYQVGYNDNGDPTLIGYNVFIGYHCFYNDIGQYNMGIGYRAGYYNDTTGVGDEGTRNVYLGYHAGEGAVTGNTGRANVAIGTSALSLNTSGYSNMAIGYNALLVNTSGYYNVAIGGSALRSNTDGYQSMAFGHNSLYSNIGGFRNTAIGDTTLYSNTTGDYNIGIGYKAGARTQTGNNNVCIGTEAGLGESTKSFSDNTFIGHQAGYSASTGSDNIFIGYQAGYRQTTLSDRLIIDNRVRADVATELTNAILYGIMAAAPADQSLRINAVCNVTENIQIDGTQVISNRVVDARCDDAINSGDATTDGVIDALRDAMITHGLIAAA